MVVSLDISFQYLAATVLFYFKEFALSLLNLFVSVTAVRKSVAFGFTDIVACGVCWS